MSEKKEIRWTRDRSLTHTDGSYVVVKGVQLEKTFQVWVEKFPEGQGPDKPAPTISPRQNYPTREEALAAHQAIEMRFINDEGYGRTSSPNGINQGKTIQPLEAFFKSSKSPKDTLTEMIQQMQKVVDQM